MSAEVNQFVTPEVVEAITALAAPLLVAEYFRDPSSFRANDYYAADNVLGALPVDVRAALPYGPPIARLPLLKGHETNLRDIRPKFHRKVK